MKPNEKNNPFYLDKPSYNIPKFEKMEDELMKLNKKLKNDFENLINHSKNK